MQKQATPKQSQPRPNNPPANRLRLARANNSRSFSIARGAHAHAPFLAPWRRSI
jgi:hypothetical protein